MYAKIKNVVSNCIPEIKELAIQKNLNSDQTIELALTEGFLQALGKLVEFTEHFELLQSEPEPEPEPEPVKAFVLSDGRIIHFFKNSNGKIWGQVSEKLAFPIHQSTINEAVDFFKMNWADQQLTFEELK